LTYVPRIRWPTHWHCETLPALGLRGNDQGQSNVGTWVNMDSAPTALFNKSLHPPTGLVRWIRQFHVDQRRTQVREIQRQFAHYLGGTRGRCDVLVRRMLRRTGRLALLRELCDF